VVVGPSIVGGEEVFAIGSDNALWHNWLDSQKSNWSGWQGLGSPVLATLNIRSKACVKDGATRSFSSPFVEQTGGEKVLT
jgi:hypothetical protein